MESARTHCRCRVRAIFDKYACNFHMSVSCHTMQRGPPILVGCGGVRVAFDQDTCKFYMSRFRLPVQWSPPVDVPGCHARACSLSVHTTPA